MISSLYTSAGKTLTKREILKLQSLSISTSLFQLSSKSLHGSFRGFCFQLWKSAVNLFEMLIQYIVFSYVQLSTTF